MITLTKIDPDRHMARFYSVAVLPDLFGGCRRVARVGPPRPERRAVGERLLRNRGGGYGSG
jgi:hypothetical protein